MSEVPSEKRTELFDIGGQEQYLLYSKTAIVRVLQDLSRRPEIITAYFNNGREYILTAVLTVMQERDMVVLDYGADELLNRRLLEADRIVCVTKHDNISVKFSCTGLQRAKFQDRQAFAALLPETLFRLQRREFFRVSTPVAHPIRCHIPRPPENEVVLNLVDISCGGIGLVDPSQRFDPELYEILPNCRLALPGLGTIVCDLEVRNNYTLLQNDGRQVRRIGCTYVNLTHDRNTLIQRYIHRVQIEQKALARD